MFHYVPDMNTIRPRLLGEREETQTQEQRRSASYHLERSVGLLLAYYQVVQELPCRISIIHAIQRQFPLGCRTPFVKDKSRANQKYFMRLLRPLRKSPSSHDAR